MTALKAKVALRENLVNGLGSLLAPERLVFAFISFLAWNTWNHSMWRDEIQGWAIAMDSPTFGQFLYHMHHQGHPGLWYFLLWLASFITSSPYAVQVIHFLTSVALYLLVAFRAPLTRMEKILLMANFYMISEYTVIARNYGPGMLLLFAYGCERPGGGKAAIRQYAWLGLAANMNFYAAVLAGLIAFQRTYDDFRAGRREYAAIATFSALMACAIFVMIPATDHYDPLAGPFAWGDLPEWGMRLAYVVPGYMGRAFMPMDPGRWPVLAVMGGSIILGVASLLSFRKETRALLVLAGTMAICGTFAFITLLGVIRHQGIVLMAFLLCLMLYRHRGALRGPIFALLLLPGAVAGIDQAVRMQQYAFTDSKQTASWIVANGLDNEFWVGEWDTAISPFAYLEKKRWSLECSCTEGYMMYTRQRTTFPSSEVPERMGAVMTLKGLNHAMLLQSTTTVPADTAAWAEQRLEVERLPMPQGPADHLEETFVAYKVTRLPTLER